MRRFTYLATACLCAATLAPKGALSQDATWLGTGASFNSAGSWTPAIVPRGAATFGQAQQTSVFIESAFTAGQTSVGAFIFTPDAPAYTFNPGISFLFHIPSQLVFNGAGIINNSSNRPTIVNNFASTTFTNGSGAGNAILNISCFSSSFCGSMAFANTSSAANSTISNTSFLIFSDSATGGNATIVTGATGLTRFVDTASGGNATIITNQQGETRFEGRASAGNANLVVNDGGTVTFRDRSTGGNATITSRSGGRVSFVDQASGGLARVIADSGSVVSFASNTSVGSVEGHGTFLINALVPNVQLAVGTNNLSTEVTGAITSLNPATLLKLGSGTLTLSGPNTLNGLSIAGGAVATAADASLGSANGSLALGGGGALRLLSSFDLSPTRTMAIGTGGGAIDTNGFNMTITQAITGPGGLLKTGNGTLTLTGNSTYGCCTALNGGSLVVNGRLASAVTVNAGSLVVNGSLASTMTVGSGGSAVVNGTVASDVVNAGTTTVNGLISGSVANIGLLGGTGVIIGRVANSGTVAPGNSIGTLTVSGGYTHSSSGTLAAEVAGAGQSDRLTVGGTANLQGGTVSVSALPGTTYAPRTTYTILNAAGGVNGAFASVNNLYPFLQSSLSYDPTNVYLTLQIGGFAAAAQTPVQQAVGAVLDANALNASGDFAAVLGTMASFTSAQGQAAMTALSGNNYAGFSSAMVQGAQLFMNNFANQTGGGGSPASTRVALAEACEVACDANAPPLWGAWGGGLGGLGTVGANAGSGTVTYNVGGFAAGLDRLLTPNIRVGVTAGYTTGSQWVGGFDGRGTSDTFQTGLYAGYSQGPVYLDGIVGYAYSYNQMWRNILIPGLQPRTAQGRTGANQFYGQVETGYRFDLGTSANAFVTPFARLQAYTGTQNGFSETGAQSLSLTVAQQTTNSLRSVIGAQLGGSMDLGWREKLAAQVRLGWSHEYADTARPVSATFAGAPTAPFTTFGASLQRDGVVIGLAANTAIAEGTSVYLRYEGDISGQDSAHALTAGVRMSW